MSLASRPGATYPITLPSDSAVPEDRRPKFIAEHMSCLEWADFAAFADDKEALQKLSLPGIVAALGAIIAPYIRGWSNVFDKAGIVPYPTDQSDPSEHHRAVAQALGRVLGLDDAWELYDAIRIGSRLSVTEKNVSTSPSDSPGDSSAGAAQAPAQA